MNGRGRRDRRGMPTGGGLLRTTRGRRRGASDGLQERGEDHSKEISSLHLVFVGFERLPRLSAAGRLVASGREAQTFLALGFCVFHAYFCSDERGEEDVVQSRHGATKSVYMVPCVYDGTAPGVVSRIADIKRGMMMSAGGGVSGWWAWAGAGGDGEGILAFSSYLM